MELRRLRYFVQVALEGSLGKASRALGVAQPALSRQVRLLESDLRCVLLQRTGRGVVLTEAGKRLFEHSVAILQLVAQAREDLAASRDEPTGRIVIGLPPSMGRILTLPLVERFRDTLPKARLAIVEGLSTHLTEWIATGRVDIGLVLNPQAQPAIDTQPMLDEPLCLISPAGTPPRAGRRAVARLATDAPLPFAQMPQFPLVIPDRSHAIRRLVETQAALTGIRLQVAWEVSGVQAILELVRTGHGHAILTPGAVLASGVPLAFRVRPLAEPQLLSRLCLAAPASKPLTPLMRHAMRLLRELALLRVGNGAHIKLR